MTRTLTDHKVNEVNDGIAIQVMDEPGAGGANHHYRIRVSPGDKPSSETDIMFQNGPIKEAGINGLTQEALLAIVIDRLRSFQAGPFTCKENSVALTHIETGLMWLNQRTRNRQARGVEGTHEK